MARRVRIDTELVRRGLARSRQHAAELLAAGHVLLDGEVVTKPARQVDPAQALRVDLAETDDYVSRGAHKLAGALDALGDAAPVVAGRRCLDAGASTGGFTDVLLRRGAAHVVAVDVGYGQLAWSLQTDARVTVLDRTNVRTLTPEMVAPAPELVVGDMSFISLTLVLPALARAAAPDADLLLMVKPQFEVGKERLGHGGVVRDPALHVESVLTVAAAAARDGLDTWAVVPSPLPGPSGNVEYFVALRRDHPRPLRGADLEAAAAGAVRTGPAGTGNAGAHPADASPAGAIRPTDPGAAAPADPHRETP
ncbi:TlyA family RNA methyltransferase [Georgenia ruanii]|uniref:TlyA family rRNA (Cytidine-2'-O)-methyltransferase n=1 Tax=Georgenia ruanii TaxID=348442 RepID=A0A7J9V073_9MICO|nr:TlyA family RNA methyltransferase [Georgenia ruanii]MPV90003.1 TlyA family rRNA (cytidine-2'-O)-methyltransferase [Georgenia ruanii]